MSHKEVSLSIEYFYNDEDTEFHISSKKQMLSILQSIADHGTRVALYYGSGYSFIPTTLLGVNEHGMWLDVGPSPTENKHLLLSEKITFVSVHQHVKIQFQSHDIQNDLFENNEAFYLKLPEYVLRLQRREFFRTPIPSTAMVSCIFPVEAENPGDPIIMREIYLLDISGGGVGLLCGEHEIALLPKRIFPGCKMSIPDFGILNVTIEVRNSISITIQNNAVLKRVGCRFVGLDNKMNILLQRYITRLQGESLIKQ